MKQRGVRGEIEKWKCGKREKKRQKQIERTRERERDTERGMKEQRVGSGCGSVGRAVASDTRGPQFEPSHWQALQVLPKYCQLY